MEIQSKPARLNLPAIDRALRDFQSHFNRVNTQLSVPRDPMSDEVRENMLTGYRMIDFALSRHIDLFANGQSKLLLSLNTLVLLGDTANETMTAKYSISNESRFYNRVGGGVGEFIEHMQQLHAFDCWSRAAAAYVHILNQPQLFSEGNHRTGTLIASYLLAWAGCPPFVVSERHAVYYFNLSIKAKEFHRNRISSAFKIRQLRRELANLLQQASDPRLSLKET